MVTQRCAAAFPEKSHKVTGIWQIPPTVLPIIDTEWRLAR